MAKSKRQKTPVISLAVIAFAVILVMLSARGSDDSGIDKSSTNKLKADSSSLIVHYIDIGQGDSEFIELPNGQCMLIDCGEGEYSDKVIESIEGYGYSRVDYLVATHPHTDHIGGMAEVINSLDVGEIYMPKVSSSTKTFERLLNAISDCSLQINRASAGKSILSEDLLNIEILAPISDEYNDLNNYSAVIKITYGENSFLFTGDAETLVEDEMLSDSYSQLDCDVLKVGHHGSSSSTSMRFLDAVTPEYAVISCGDGNSYGHPHREALTRLAKIGAQVYRTDYDGTITITCDGNNGFGVETEK